MRVTTTFSQTLKRKNSWLRLFLFLLILSLSNIPSVFADKSISLTTYYPVPVGVYDRLTLIPQVSLPTSCSIGMFMVDQSSGNINYCHDDGAGHGVWGGLEGVWAIAGNNIYPLGSISNTNLSIGIGTATPSFKLHLEKDGGILAIGQFDQGASLSNYVVSSYRNFLWYPRKAAFRAGGNGTWNDIDIGNYSVGFGLTPSASGMASSISGGDSNIAAGNYSSILGGNANNITNTAQYSTVVGGTNNSITGEYSSISGSSNAANGNDNVIAGGTCNFASGTGSTVSGGADNNSQQDNGGASRCRAEATIGTYSTLSGGALNRISGDYSTILGGYSSLASGTYATIAGYAANKNQVSGNYSTLLGGGSDSGILTHNWSVGLGNNIGSDSNFWPYQTIIGQGIYAGYSGFLAGSGDPVGAVNSTYANVTTGFVNFTGGQYSWVGGARQISQGSRSFVWGIDPLSERTTTTSNAFIINTGKVGIHQTNPTYYLEILENDSTDFFAITSNRTANTGDVFIVKSNGYIGIGNRSPNYPLQIGNLTTPPNNPVGILTVAGTWTTPSSRNYKSNIKPLNMADAYKTFHELNPVHYVYKAAPQIPHAGFIAEDVPALVSTPNRDSFDLMGVIAVLTIVVQDHKKEITNQTHQLDNLDKKLNDLEKQLTPPPPNLF